MKACTIVSILAFAGSAFSVCSRVGSTQITFYGYPDNDPPGPATAYNCGGRNYVAGGSGTYADPTTMASASGEFAACEIVYVPYLKKYVRYEDYCQQCTDDWGSGIKHIDIWTGENNVSGGDAQISCEEALTPDGTITYIKNPATTYAVDNALLYHKGNENPCRTNHIYPGASATTYCA